MFIDNILSEATSANPRTPQHDPRWHMCMYGLDMHQNVILEAAILHTVHLNDGRIVSDAWGVLNDVPNLKNKSCIFTGPPGGLEVLRNYL